MSDFIIAAIVVLAAAKAKSQAKDTLTNPKGGGKFEGNREVAT